MRGNAVRSWKQDFEQNSDLKNHKSPTQPRELSNLPPQFRHLYFHGREFSLDSRNISFDGRKISLDSRKVSFDNREISLDSRHVVLSGMPLSDSLFFNLSVSTTGMTASFYYG